jgi:DNA-binding NtrC family response regulator
VSYDAECYCGEPAQAMPGAPVVELCVFCEMERDSRLEKLGKNLMTAGALHRASREVAISLQLTLVEAEARFIAQVLEDCGGCITAAAVRLDVYRSTLQRKMRKEPLATMTGRRPA